MRHQRGHRGHRVSMAKFLNLLNKILNNHLVCVAGVLVVVIKSDGR